MDLKTKCNGYFYIGYFTLFLIVFRIIWGFVGTQHAKFSSFITGPRKVFNYIKTLFNRQSEPAIGHNPLGGWFVVVMLVLLTIQAVSGLFMTDDIFLDGPYRQLAGEETLALMNTLHHLAFDVLLYVIALHIGAVIFYSVYKKQKLVPPWCMAIRSQQQQVLLTREFYVLLLWRSSPQQLYMWLLKYTRQLHRQMNITTS